MSQVQFSGSCSQDSGSQGRKSQVPGTQFKGPVCQGPSSRVPESLVLGLRVSSLRVPRSRVSGPDFRLWRQKGVPKNFFIKKRNSGTGFSSEFREIFKNTIFYRTPPVAASCIIAQFLLTIRITGRMSVVY